MSSSSPETCSSVDWMSGTVSDMYTFSFECLLPSSGATPRSVLQTVLAILSPFLVIGIFCVYWVCKTLALGQSWSYFIQRYILTTVCVLYVSYLSLVHAVIHVFYCVDIFDSDSLESVNSSHSRWVADTSVQCFAGSHRILAYSLALPLLVFVLVYPMILAAVIKIAQRKDELNCEWIQVTLGILFNGFRTRFAFWDCVILLRKALIATIVIFAYKFGGSLQGNLLVCVFLSALYLHLSFWPYQANLGPLNFLEGLSLFVSASTVMSGVILSDPKTTSGVVQACLVLFIFALNASAFFIFGYYLSKYKYMEIKCSLLSDDVDCGGIASVMKMFWIHKARKAKELAKKLAAAMSWVRIIPPWDFLERRLAIPLLASSSDTQTDRLNNLQ